MIQARSLLAKAPVGMLALLFLRYMMECHMARSDVMIAKCIGYMSCRSSPYHGGRDDMDKH